MIMIKEMLNKIFVISVVFFFFYVIELLFVIGKLYLNSSRDK